LVSFEPREWEEVADSLNAASCEIGELGFHLRLLDLIGSLIPHETGWIVRYAPGCDPDVLHTKQISSNIVQYYLGAEPSSTDPYFCSWRSNTVARVETMEAALPSAADKNFYSLDFMKKMEFTDELAIFLPSVGKTCLSLFFERKSDRFTKSDIERIERFFPIVLGLHQAHTRTLMTAMYNAAHAPTSFHDSPAAIFDRHGKLVYSTHKWRQLAETEGTVRNIEWSLSYNDIREQLADGVLPFKGTALDCMNSIAPGGLLLHHVGEGPWERNAGEQASLSIVDQLTPRERDIIALTLEGLSTGAIAQRLQISKGTVKNCRQRIYRKLEVSSERELVSSLMPFANQLKNQLAHRKVRILPCNALEDDE
jgi:DNA-binding CsgD family transcriptional regulator